MNNVFLQGNLAADPISRAVGQSKVVVFTIAVSDRYKKQNGDWSDDTQFLDCEAWDSAANTIEQYWRKGDPVLVEGKLRKEIWEKDGVKQSRQKVRVQRFQKFSRAQKTEQVVEEPQVETSNVGGGEDIPF